MRNWTPPMLRHLKFIVWSIFWALDQSFWLLELQVMTLQSEQLGHFWHFFNNLEIFLSFFHFSSFTSNLDFLINSCSNVTMDHTFLIYGPWHSIFAKISILPLVQQMNFVLQNPNFWFLGNAFFGQIGKLWMDPWGSFEHIEPYLEALAQSQMKISSGRL